MRLSLSVNQKRFFPYLGAALVFFAVGASDVVADTWSLPSTLNDSNTSITFEADSTWHLIRGTTKKVQGDISLTNPKDPLSIKVDVRLPVRLFNTDWESRDERLQEVMAATKYPLVSFTSRRLSENCHPREIDKVGSCKGTLAGTLTMRDVSKDVALPVEVVKNLDTYRIRGSLPVQWADYNIEDPSILVAKLDETVTISYETSIPLKR